MNVRAMDSTGQRPGKGRVKDQDAYNGQNSNTQPRVTREST